MIKEYFIDLTEKKPGCTENPVVRLSQLLSRVEEGNAVLKVVSDEREIPLKVLEKLAEKRGLKIILLERDDTKITVVYFKDT
ncbi:MAG: hypothetical protein QXK95_01685 [Nitrososphaerota archaeon]|nr:hypothetical protein [Candidatus Geocrenenecus dongiae]